MARGSERDEIALQREYYKVTATDDQWRDVHAHDEHFLALVFLEAAVEAFGIKSILDVGAGAGRMAFHLKSRFPEVTVKAVEPVKELREVGHRNGLSPEDLMEGDATSLAFDDDQFDLVCEFGILHHIPRPRRAVREMLRVGRRGIFISDSNNFGRGSFLGRTGKQILNMLHLWQLAYLVRTGGKGYAVSEGDGLAYSYSVFNDLPLIREHCDVHLFNTVDGGANLYRTASHVAVLGLKK